MSINLLTTPILLKTLGETSYGLQSLVAVIIGYIAFIDMGLDLPITKFLAEYRAFQDSKAEQQLLNTTLQLYMCIGIFGMILLIALSDWLARGVFHVSRDMYEPTVSVFRLAGIGFLGSVGMLWGRAVVMGLQRFDLNYLVSVSLNSAGTLIGLIVVLAGYGVVGYVFARVIVTMFAGPIYFFSMRRLIKNFHFHFGIDKKIVLRIRSYIGYGSLIRIISSLISRLDQMLLGFWFGVAISGIYAVPFMLVNAFTVMLAYMLGFIFPMASELQSLKEMERLREVFIRASRFIAALAGLIFISIFVLGDLLLTVWVPKIALSATNVLRLLSVAAYISTLTVTLPNNVIVGLGKMKQFSIYIVTRAVTLAILSIVLIPQMGLEGAGLSLLISCVVDIIYFFTFLNRFIRITPRQFLRRAYGKPLILGIGYAGLLFLARPLVTSWPGIIVCSPILIFLYVILGFLLGVFDETEKRATSELLRMVKK